MHSLMPRAPQHLQPLRWKSFCSAWLCVLSCCALCAVVAHIGTGTWLQAILNLLMLNDTLGTAAVMFMVAKHFETAVITSGNDITSLMRVRPTSPDRCFCVRLRTVLRGNVESQQRGAASILLGLQFAC